MIRHLGPHEWTLLVQTMTSHSYRQLLAFGVVTGARMRAMVETVGVFDAGACVGLATVRIKSLPLRSGGVAYISGGPLLRMNGTSDDLRATLSALVDEYVHRRRLVLRIVPPVEWALRDWDCAGVFGALGFEESQDTASYRTIVIDLSAEESEILAGFHSKWRNCLSAAKRHGLTVRTSSDDEDLARFGELHQQLMERKSFDVELDVDTYRRVHQASALDERLEVRLVEHEGVPVAGHVSSALGESSVYLFGASTPEGNRLKASYLLQWDAIVAAQKQGMRWYDLGGIDPEANPGVYRFKSRMNGIDVTAPGPFEMLPAGIPAHVTQVAEAGHRQLRRWLPRTRG